MLPIASRGPEYEISLDIKIKSFLKENPGCIFRFSSISGAGTALIGMRSPYLGTRRASHDKLEFFADLNSRPKG